MKSRGEESALVFTCENEECGEKTTINIALKDVYVTKSDNHNKLIKLSDTLAVQMKYPTVEELTLIDDSNGVLLAQQLAITSCIDSIYTGNEVLKASEQTPEELTDFMETMTGEQYKKFKEFFDTIPNTQLDLKWKCPKCGHAHDQSLKGLTNFF
jgi:rubrerythrin